MDVGMVAAELANQSRPADELIGVLAQPKAPVVKLCLANARLTWPVPGQRFLFFAQIQAPPKRGWLPDRITHLSACIMRPVKIKIWAAPAP
ncbi:MAG: hypothetical protein EBS66_15615 [Betaproteobacteria bacterium]|nr:hypothetical protein [Betaproteobacteria bacterium]